MKRVMKWLLLPVLMVAVLTVAVPQRADARVRVWVGPGYYSSYYAPGYYWRPRAYWYAPYRVYRPWLGPRVYAGPSVYGSWYWGY